MANSILWNKKYLSKNKKYVFKSLKQSSMLYGVWTCVLDRHKANTFLAPEMNFWWMFDVKMSRMSRMEINYNPETALMKKNILFNT